MHDDLDIVRAYVVEELGGARGAVPRDEEPLFESLLDSTNVLALVAFLEERFRIEIRDSEVVPANFATLGRIAAYLGRKKAEETAEAAEA